MIKRIFIGLVLGALVGGALAAGLVLGLGITIFDQVPAMAYLAAAVTGVVTGLVAGKPIWSADGKIEAGLKAVFGAALAAGAMFGLRRLVHVDLDLTALRAGAGSAGELVATTIPAIAVALGFLFEVDNTDPPAPKAGGTRVAGGARVGGASPALGAGKNADGEDEDREEAAARKARR